MAVAVAVPVYISPTVLSLVLTRVAPAARAPRAVQVGGPPVTAVLVASVVAPHLLGQVIPAIRVVPEAQGRRLLGYAVLSPVVQVGQRATAVRRGLIAQVAEAEAEAVVALRMFAAAVIVSLLFVNLTAAAGVASAVPPRRKVRALRPQVAGVPGLPTPQVERHPAIPMVRSAAAA